jgi:NAD(P)-dependent dehydrogenase (short-subunit alcohol dehydrogenase family)
VLIEGSVALVTGANRGLGAHLVEQLHQRGAARVYATARRHQRLEAEAGREGIVPLALDVEDQRSVDAAASAATDVNLLVNNAGVLAFGGALEVDFELLERDMRVNYLGMLRVTRAFAPIIESNGGGAVLNVLSLLALAPRPGLAAYCASKAAADSATQGLRVTLAPRGIRVHASYPGRIDTEMIARIEAEKAAPSDVAAGLLDGLEADLDEIAPDPVSRSGLEQWRTDPRGYAEQFLAPFVLHPPVRSG